MNLSSKVDGFNARFMKTDSNNVIVGGYDPKTQIYVGKLDGWKVTRVVVAALIATAAAVATIAIAVILVSNSCGFSTFQAYAFHPDAVVLPSFLLIPLSVMIPPKPKPCEQQLEDNNWKIKN